MHAPLSSNPSHILHLVILQFFRWEGSDDKGADIAHEFNAIEECHEMEQEIMLWCSLRGGAGKSRERGQPMGLYASMGS